MNRIILALDTKNLEEAISITKRVQDRIFTIKLGLEFFNAHGKAGIKKFNDMGIINLMLDLKFKDIPQTIYKAIKALDDIKFGFLTIHGQGGKKMIEKAKANAIACGVNVEYILGDMTQLSRRFSEGFDLITCLGDTLAHVGNKKDVSRTLKEIQNCLNPNGLFVIQSLNYANIIKKKIRFLPPSLPPNLMSETQYFRTLDYTKGSFILNLTEHAWYKNKWAVSNFSTKITPSVSYTHLTLPTNREV